MVFQESRLGASTSFDAPYAAVRTQVKRHLALVAVRIVMALLVAAALPLSHLWFGQDPASEDVDGSQAFIFLIVFALVGSAFALGLLVIGSVVHAFARRKPRVVLWTDLSLGVVALCCAVFVGVTATYGNVP